MCNLWLITKSPLSLVIEKVASFIWKRIVFGKFDHLSNYPVLQLLTYRVPQPLSVEQDVDSVH